MSVGTGPDEVHLLCSSIYGFEKLIPVASDRGDRVTGDYLAVRQVEEGRRFEFRAVCLGERLVG